MSAYLFVWNSKPETWTKSDNELKEFQLTGECIITWRCNTKFIKPGDRAFLMKVGSKPKGIFGSGVTTTSAYKEDDTLLVQIKLDILLNPRTERILNIDELQKDKLSEQNWTPQASGISIRPYLIEELEKKWFEFLSTDNKKSSIIIPSTNEIDRAFLEGSSNQITLTKYERNPFARKACIDFYGHKCSICDFDFESKYGQIGKDFIHVHHLTMISSLEKEYLINPIKDLRPVCPNCHAMLHRQNPPLSIDELKRLLN